MYIPMPDDKVITYTDLGDKTIKQYLLDKGMEEADFDNHEGDLYVRVTPISERFFALWQYGNQVHRFIDNIEHVPWFDVPFGYMAENMKQRTESK